MCRDHTAIYTTFKLKAIKFKVTEKIVTYIEWKIIGNHKKTNDLFNNSLSMSVYGRTTYSKFNKYILQAVSGTAITKN